MRSPPRVRELSLQLAMLATLIASSSFLVPSSPVVHSSVGRSVALRCQAVAESVDALHDWLESRGMPSAKVSGKKLPGFGLSLVAPSSGVQPGDTLLSVPVSLHITPTSVRGSPLGKAVEEVLDDDSALLAVGLMEQVGLGEKSAFAAYIDILPTADAMNVPLLWSAEERSELLRGSHLNDAVDGALASLAEQWRQLEAGPFASQPELFPREVFRFEVYLWAHGIVLTRALPFGDDLSLIPFLDLANHQAGAQNTCSIGVSRADGDVAVVTEAWQLEQLGGEAAAVITAGAALAAGEQARRHRALATALAAAWSPLRR
jgi:hypothetical protein